MGTVDLRCTWTDVNGQNPETHQTTLDEFLHDNDGDDETCEAVRALALGKSVTLGGGAEPLFTIERIS